ncbi:MAG: CBS domain-containing protein, partial [Candidatus Neomarinimicrobiota bacterium]
MKKEMFGLEITVLRDTFRRLLRRRARTNILKLVEKTHPADMALIFRYFNESEQNSVFEFLLPTEQTIEFLNELDESTAARLIEAENPEKIAEFLQAASSNERAYLMGLVNENFATAVIEMLKADDQEELEEIMAYPEDSAGSLMYTDVFSLHEDLEAKDAIRAIQDQEEAEMVFYLYVIDDQNRLSGVVSLRDLVTTPANTKLKNIMSKKVHSVKPETDQEDVARIVSQYNILAVPVLDNEE